MTNAIGRLGLTLAVAAGLMSQDSVQADRGERIVVGAQPVDPVPKPIGFNPRDSAGRMFNHAIRDLLRRGLKDAFSPTGQMFLVPAAGTGGFCVLRMQPATNSHNLPPAGDANAEWYPIALLTNESNCKPRGLEIGSGEIALWMVDINRGQQTGKGKEIGEAEVVVISDHAWERDDSAPKKAAWRLRQCAHSAPHPTDDALIWIGSDVCDRTADAHHGSKEIADELRGALSARVAAVASGDPVLWFACGLDCCYADLAGTIRP